MRSRKGTLPKIWLMTDERGGDPVALARQLPPGAGIVFRHHTTPRQDRHALFERVRHVARVRRLTLLLAGTPSQAGAWGAHGAHHRSLLRSNGLRSMAVHGRRDLTLAERTDADLIFVSPVFATRSHPGAAPLGISRTGLLVGRFRHRAIALGGLGPSEFKRLRGLRLHGWAAIDAFRPA